MNPWKRNRTSSPDNIRTLRAASIAVMIPAILVLSPLVGYLLGHWVGGFIGHRDAAAIVGLFFGLVAGGMQTVDLVRRIISEVK